MDEKILENSLNLIEESIDLSSLHVGVEPTQADLVYNDSKARLFHGTEGDNHQNSNFIGNMANNYKKKYVSPGVPSALSKIQSLTNTITSETNKNDLYDPSPAIAILQARLLTQVPSVKSPLDDDLSSISNTGTIVIDNQNHGLYQSNPASPVCDMASTSHVSVFSHHKIPSMFLPSGMHVESHQDSHVVSNFSSATNSPSTSKNILRSNADGGLTQGIHLCHSQKPSSVSHANQPFFVHVSTPPHITAYSSNRVLAPHKASDTLVVHTSPSLLTNDLANTNITSKLINTTSIESQPTAVIFGIPFPLNESTKRFSDNNFIPPLLNENISHTHVNSYGIAVVQQTHHHFPALSIGSVVSVEEFTVTASAAIQNGETPPTINRDIESSKSDKDFVEFFSSEAPKQNILTISIATDENKLGANDIKLSTRNLDFAVKEENEIVQPTIGLNICNCDSFLEKNSQVQITNYEHHHHVELCNKLSVNVLPLVSSSSSSSSLISPEIQPELPKPSHPSSVELLSSAAKSVPTNFPQSNKNQLNQNLLVKPESPLSKFNYPEGSASLERTWLPSVRPPEISIPPIIDGYPHQQEKEATNHIELESKKVFSTIEENNNILDVKSVVDSGSVTNPSYIEIEPIQLTELDCHASPKVKLPIPFIDNVQQPLIKSSDQIQQKKKENVGDYHYVLNSQKINVYADGCQYLSNNMGLSSQFNNHQNMVLSPATNIPFNSVSALHSPRPLSALECSPVEAGFRDNASEINDTIQLKLSTAQIDKNNCIKQGVYLTTDSILETSPRIDLTNISANHDIKRLKNFNSSVKTVLLPSDFSSSSFADTRNDFQNKNSHLPSNLRCFQDKFTPNLPIGTTVIVDSHTSLNKSGDKVITDRDTKANFNSSSGMVKLPPPILKPFQPCTNSLIYNSQTNMMNSMNYPTLYENNHFSGVHSASNSFNVPIAVHTKGNCELINKSNNGFFSVRKNLLFSTSSESSDSNIYCSSSDSTEGGIINEDILMDTAAVEDVLFSLMSEYRSEKEKNGKENNSRHTFGCCPKDVDDDGGRLYRTPSLSMERKSNNFDNEIDLVREHYKFGNKLYKKQPIFESTIQGKENHVISNVSTSSIEPIATPLIHGHPFYMYFPELTDDPDNPNFSTYPPHIQRQIYLKAKQNETKILLKSASTDAKIDDPFLFENELNTSEVAENASLLESMRKHIFRIQSTKTKSNNLNIPAFTPGQSVFRNDNYQALPNGTVSNLRIPSLPSPPRNLLPSYFNDNNQTHPIQNCQEDNSACNPTSIVCNSNTQYKDSLNRMAIDKLITVIDDEFYIPQDNKKTNFTEGNSHHFGYSSLIGIATSPDENSPYSLTATRYPPPHSLCYAEDGNIPISDVSILHNEIECEKEIKIDSFPFTVQQHLQVDNNENLEKEQCVDTFSKIKLKKIKRIKRDGFANNSDETLEGQTDSDRSPFTTSFFKYAPATGNRFPKVLLSASSSYESSSVHDEITVTREGESCKNSDKIDVKALTSDLKLNSAFESSEGSSIRCEYPLKSCINFGSDIIQDAVDALLKLQQHDNNLNTRMDNTNKGNQSFSTQNINEIEQILISLVEKHSKWNKMEDTITNTQSKFPLKTDTMNLAQVPICSLRGNPCNQTVNSRNTPQCCINLIQPSVSDAQMVTRVIHVTPIVMVDILSNKKEHQKANTSFSNGEHSEIKQCNYKIHYTDNIPDSSSSVSTFPQRLNQHYNSNHPLGNESSVNSFSLALNPPENRSTHIKNDENIEASSFSNLHLLESSNILRIASINCRSSIPVLFSWMKPPTMSLSYFPDRDVNTLKVILNDFQLLSSHGKSIAHLMINFFQSRAKFLIQAYNYQKYNHNQDSTTGFVNSYNAMIDNEYIYGNSPLFSPTNIFLLLRALLASLSRLPTNERVLADLQPPVKVYGDLRGDLGTLLESFESLGWPSGIGGDVLTLKYVFMGNLTDPSQQVISNKETNICCYCMHDYYCCCYCYADDHEKASKKNDESEDLSDPDLNWLSDLSINVTENPFVVEGGNEMGVKSELPAALSSSSEEEEDDLEFNCNYSHFSVSHSKDKTNSNPFSCANLPSPSVLVLLLLFSLKLTYPSRIVILRGATELTNIHGRGRIFYDLIDWSCLMNSIFQKPKKNCKQKYNKVNISSRHARLDKQSPTFIESRGENSSLSTPKQRIVSSQQIAINNDNSIVFASPTSSSSLPSTLQNFNSNFENMGGIKHSSNHFPTTETLSSSLRFRLPSLNDQSSNLLSLESNFPAHSTPPLPPLKGTPLLHSPTDGFNAKTSAVFQTKSTAIQDRTLISRSYNTPTKKDPKKKRFLCPPLWRTIDSIFCLLPVVASVAAPHVVLLPCGLPPSINSLIEAFIGIFNQENPNSIDCKNPMESNNCFPLFPPPSEAMGINHEIFYKSLWSLPLLSPLPATNEDDDDFGLLKTSTPSVSPLDNLIGNVSRNEAYGLIYSETDLWNFISDSFFKADDHNHSSSLQKIHNNGTIQNCIVIRSGIVAPAGYELLFGGSHICLCSARDIDSITHVLNKDNILTENTILNNYHDKDNNNLTCDDDDDDDDDESLNFLDVSLQSNSTTIMRGGSPLTNYPPFTPLKGNHAAILIIHADYHKPIPKTNEQHTVDYLRRYIRIEPIIIPSVDPVVG